MASLTTEPNGRSMIRFEAPNGKRPKIRLGKIDLESAEKIKGHVEHLAECWREKKLPWEATRTWVAELLSDPAKHRLYDRLAAAGLVTKRDKPESCQRKRKKTGQQVFPTTLGPFLDAYVASRSDVKQSTRYNFDQIRGNLVEFLGREKPLADVTPGDADEFRRWLRTEKGYAEGTTRRNCGRAKEWFNVALRKRLIPENPFADMKKLQVKGNVDRAFFVTLDVAYAVLAAMTDRAGEPIVQWQLIFALGRFGALRCPSELSLLRWEDVDWEANKITVHSPKTERYDGKELRVMPLFPELRPYLEAAFNEAQDGLGRPPSGTDFVIDARYRGAKKNLRTGLERFLKRAGVDAWPKLFQNLRATRAKELTEFYPQWMVTKWCGHEEDVAKEHYWHMSEADWQRAATEPTCGEKWGRKTGRNTPKNPIETPSGFETISGGEPPETPSESGFTGDSTPLTGSPGRNRTFDVSSGFQGHKRKAGRKSGPISARLRELADVVDGALAHSSTEELREICELVEALSDALLCTV